MKSFLSGFGVGLIAAAIIIAIVHIYRRVDPRPSAPAPVARELHGVLATVVSCKPIVIYRDKVKAALGLPDEVKANPDRQVVAATKIPRDDRAHTVSAVADLTSGRVDLFVRDDPLPWFAIEHRGAAGFARGFRSGAPIYRLTAREDLLQLKAAHVGLVGSVDSDGQWFAGVGVRVTW